MSKNTTQKRIEAGYVALPDGSKRYIIMDHERKEAYNFENRAIAGKALLIADNVPDMLHLVTNPIPSLYEALAKAMGEEKAATAKATDTSATD